MSARRIASYGVDVGGLETYAKSRDHATRLFLACAAVGRCHLIGIVQPGAYRVILASSVNRDRSAALGAFEAAVRSVAQ